MFNLQLFLKAIQMLKTAFSKTRMNEIYNVAAANLGRHLTLNNSVSEEVGCAEALSWILLNAGFNIPAGGIANVNGLIDWMLQNGFEELHAPITGAIIAAHNPDRNNPNFAHIGVCLKTGIGSNTSANGLFQENYSYQGWNNYFGSHGSHTRYFYHA